MTDIVKRFGHVLANDRVNIQLAPGEIHALLGENGAGKTTLMNILYGLYQPDSGAITIHEKPVKITSPADAISMGIGMVHQHFMLIDVFTAAENVVLGSWKPAELRMDPATVEAQVQAVANQFGFDFDPAAVVETMPVGVQQKVEIVKALYRGAKILILDEPTAVLTPQETEELFRCMRDLIAKGVSIIFISHKLDEVLEISDRVTVLRLGKVVGTQLTKQVRKEDLAVMMIGHLLERMPKPARTPQSPGLTVKDLTVIDRQKVEKVKGLSLRVEKGQIIGVAGIDGNGQVELANAIAGIWPAASGAVSINGVDMDARSITPRRFTDLGGAYIPQDRSHTGLILDFSSGENLVLKRYRQPPFVKHGFLQHRIIHENAAKLLAQYDVRPPDPYLQTGKLSGGNQQKVILARELHEDPSVIVVCYPTRGLDIGATEFVHQQLIQHRSQGAAILFISNELEELMEMSDKILVLHRGEIMGLVEPAATTPETLGLLMMGQKVAAHE